MGTKKTSNRTGGTQKSVVRYHRLLQKKKLKNRQRITFMSNTTSKKSSNFQQAMWLAIGQFCTFAMSFVSAAILSRYFDKNDYGTYKQILYIYSTLVTLFLMGLPSAFSYFIPRLEKGEQKAFINSLNRVLVIIGAIISILLFVFSDTIAHILENPELATGLKIAAPFPLLTLPCIGVEGIYTALRETKKLAVYHIITKTFTLSCTITPVLLFGSNYKYAIYGWGLASFLIFLTAMYMKNKPYKKTEKIKVPNMYKDIFTYSTPLLGAFLGGSLISMADQFFISRYYGTSVFAEYSNGCLNIPFIIMVTSSIKNVLLPLFSKANADKNMEVLLNTYNNAVNKSIVLLIPLITFCFVFSKEIMIFIYGEQYSTSSIFFKCFIVREVVDILPYFSVLMALGMSKTYMNIHIYGAIYMWLVGWMITSCNLPPYLIVIAGSLLQFAIRAYAFISIYRKHHIPLVTKEITKRMATVIINCLLCGYLTIFICNLIPGNKMIIINLIVSVILYYALLIPSGKIIKINYLESLLQLIKRK